MTRPVIGIPIAQDSAAGAYPKVQISCDYVRAVESAGALALLLPITAGVNEGVVAQWLSLCNGILLPGGGDIAPTFFGESPLPQVTCTCRTQDVIELLLCTMAAAINIPVLGICRGVQIMNVAFGGTLWQDVPAQYKHAVCHYQNSAIRGELFHPLTLRGDSLLARIMGGTRQESNTLHHQAVRDVAPGFIDVASTPDGLIEAIENAEQTMLGVQWHPENLSRRFPQHAALFSWLVNSAQQRMI